MAGKRVRGRKGSVATGAAGLALVVGILAGLWIAVPLPHRPAYAVQSCDYVIPPGDVAQFVAAIEQINSIGGPVPSPTPTAVPRVYVVCLSPGEYLFTAPYAGTSNALPPISANVTIQGSGAVLRRHSMEMFRFFSVYHTLALENVTLLGGAVDPYGGAIYNEGELTIGDSLLKSNAAVVQGGAIYNFAGTVRLIHTRLTHNYAASSGSGFGGAIYNTAGSLILESADVSYNTARVGGGGVYSSLGGTISIIDSVFEGNRALEAGSPGYGGGSLLNNADPYSGAVSVHNTCFSLNDPGLLNLNTVFQTDATGNWWGAADGPSGDGPGHGDSVTGNVAYVPFLAAPPPHCPPAPRPTETPTPGIPFTPTPIPTATPAYTPWPSDVPLPAGCYPSREQPGVIICTST